MGEPDVTVRPDSGGIRTAVKQSCGHVGKQVAAHRAAVDSCRIPAIRASRTPVQVTHIPRFTGQFLEPCHDRCQTFFEFESRCVPRRFRFVMSTTSFSGSPGRVYPRIADDSIEADVLYIVIWRGFRSCTRRRAYVVRLTVQRCVPATVIADSAASLTSRKSRTWVRRRE